MMLSQGTLGILVPWVSALLLREFLIDLACMVACVPWFLSNESNKDGLPLRLGAAAAMIRAFLVVVFVLGRVGPWFDFDVRQQHRYLQYTRWT
ncbi:hypothetical protein FK220_010345 [Flavobacteriaceae bacterium TP-CH-4]|uniref:Uncharacterized protein n=1 Tax=Pelagihabitans pacificus TaxID=2696054 RepID=A0A967AVC8_9FLAO|nr:hypothetical protein [Pelagihabitans pacificus]NHF59743.1 hypothetical protein [Pelagihabitans pacificus]